MIRIAVLTLFVIALLVPAAYGQSSYSIKAPEARVGTHLNETLLRAAFPFDKQWSELTPEQRQMFRAKYSNLGENDEPPFPELGMGPIAREVQKLQQRVLTDGLLVITVHVDENGDAQSVAIYQTPNPSLSKGVAYVVMNTKYKPAKCDGKPCAMDFPYSFNFTIR
jgi:hypothetical protein